MAVRLLLNEAGQRLSVEAVVDLASGRDRAEVARGSLSLQAGLVAIEYMLKLRDEVTKRR